MPIGLSLPYSASSVMPATIVGSANGRSISELRSLLPGNSSRTRTQAIAVPTTQLITVTISASEDRDPQRLERLRLGDASQKPASPPSNDFRTSATIGISTMMLR